MKRVNEIMADLNEAANRHYIINRHYYLEDVDGMGIDYTLLIDGEKVFKMSMAGERDSLSELVDLANARFADLLFEYYAAIIDGPEEGLDPEWLAKVELELLQAQELEKERMEKIKLEERVRRDEQVLLGDFNINVLDEGYVVEMNVLEELIELHRKINTSENWINEISEKEIDKIELLLIEFTNIISPDEPTILNHQYWPKGEHLIDVVELNYGPQWEGFRRHLEMVRKLEDRIAELESEKINNVPEEVRLGIMSPEAFENYTSNLTGNHSSPIHFSEEELRMISGIDNKNLEREQLKQEPVLQEEVIITQDELEPIHENDGSDFDIEKWKDWTRTATYENCLQIAPENPYIEIKLEKGEKLEVDTKEGGIVRIKIVS